MSVYLDSSALVKLVIREPGSDSLRRYLHTRGRLVSSVVARVELVRAARGHGPRAIVSARRLLDRIDLIAIEQTLLDSAADLADPTLRSLDAIHVASAQAMGSDCSALVTYDARMARIAGAIGLPVAMPE